MYQHKSKYYVLFASKHYKQKLWTNHERESAQARAFEEKGDYIIPVKLDDTTIPGLRETIGYINGRVKSPVEIGQIILKKLNKLNELDELISTLKENLPNY